MTGILGDGVTRSSHRLHPTYLCLFRAQVLTVQLFCAPLVRHTDARSGYGQEGSTSVPVAR